MTTHKTLLCFCLWAVSTFAAIPSMAQVPPVLPPGLMTPADGDVSLDAYNMGLAGRVQAVCAAGSCDTPPALVDGRAPVYPYKSLRHGLEGRAWVVFNIDDQGTPRDITLRSATAPDFGEAALAAVQYWKFKPAMLRGKAVDFQRAMQVFEFRLED